MNILTFLILIILGVSSFTFANSKIQTKEPSQKPSLNFNTGFIFGSEIGPSLRFEYEKENHSKYILNYQTSIYNPISSNILFDLGIGYGHPVIEKKNNILFTNALLTGNVQVTPKNSAIRFGTSGLIELEYRKNWSNFALNIAPCVRLLYSNAQSHSNPKLTGSWGIRAGLLYGFKLKK